MFNSLQYPVIRVESDSTKDGLVDYCYYTESLPSKIYLCPISEVPSLVQQGILPHGVSVGETYLSSPYGEFPYISIQNYETDVMKKKAHHIAMIANLLGALDCSYKIVLVSVEKRELTGDLKTQSKAYETNFDLSYRKQIEDKVNSEISVKDTFKGAIPSVEKYQQAVDYASKHNLLEDESVAKLLNARNPNSGDTNWYRSCELKIHLCQELNDNLDIAAKLGIMGDAFDFDSHFVKSVMRKIEMNLDINYTFPIPE